VTTRPTKESSKCGVNIQELLDQMQLDCMQVVVEHNNNIIPRQRLVETNLQNGDTLEVIHFVGGG
jgi:thiamine biosynthesis protein ThiS